MDKRRIGILLVLLIIFAVLLAFFYRDIFPKKRWSGQPEDMRIDRSKTEMPSDSDLLQQSKLLKDLVANKDSEEQQPEAEQPRPRIPRWRVSQRASDEDCDGKPDKKCLDFEFDTSGNSTYERYDEDCNGTPEKCVEVEYNERGKPIGSKDYQDCQDEPVVCWSASYDEVGEVTSWVVDLLCDGNPDHGFINLSDDGRIRKRRIFGPESPGCSITEYDEDGRQRRFYRLVDCMGEPTRCTNYTYEEHDEGTIENHYTDNNCDGKPEERLRVMTADDEKPLLWEEYKHGRLRFRRASIYGSDGEYIGSTRDSDGDGNPDQCYGRHESGAKGTKVSWTDEDCDGTWDSCKVREFDEHGNEIFKYDDYECDGTPDVNCITKKYELH